MSDDAAQIRGDVCDKSGKSDKRTPSNEQEVCKQLVSRVKLLEKEGQEEERKETEDDRKKERGSSSRGVRGNESENVEKNVMGWKVVTRRTGQRDKA